MNTDHKSIDEWILLTHGNSGEIMNIPISLHTTSGSMLPLIRMDTDTVTVVPCAGSDISKGDIVLIRSDREDVGVILHRVYSVQNGIIKTIGDNMTRPDGITKEENLLGKAVSVIGPGKDIDCLSRSRRFQGKLIAASHGFRPVLLPILRRLRRLSGLFQK